MPTNTRPGKGHILMVGPWTTATTTYIVVSPIVSIDGPGTEMGTREITHLGSAAREYEPTIVNGGTLTIQLWDDPTNTGQQIITSAVHTTGVPQNLFFKVVHPTTNKFDQFTATPTNWGLSGFAVDDTATRNLGLQVSGVITVATTT